MCDSLLVPVLMYESEAKYGRKWEDLGLGLYRFITSGVSWPKEKR